MLMDKELLWDWVKALRSGKYKQGYGRLKKGDYYCCLGVLYRRKIFKANGIVEDKSKFRF